MLYVARHELLGVFLEEIVDLVQDAIQPLLDAFAFPRQAILNDLIVRFFFALLGGSDACLHLLSHGSRLLAASSRRYASSVTEQLTCHPCKKLIESTGS